MTPVQPLPINASFATTDEYVESLLAFATSSQLFQHLCGGVHVLDFLTQEPDLYSILLPLEWRMWFELHDIFAILDLFLREDSDILDNLRRASETRSTARVDASRKPTWRDRTVPPQSLLDYILTIRKHALSRNYHVIHDQSNTSDCLPRHIAVGMKPKKIHEVQQFVRYIDRLSTDLASCSPHSITHIVDFGSGQNYLGRTLASPPYNKHVVALESKQHNISGAQSMDVTAKLAEKERLLRNKKQYRKDVFNRKKPEGNGTKQETVVEKSFLQNDDRSNLPSKGVYRAPGAGRIQYIETMIRDGDLSRVMLSVTNFHGQTDAEPQFMAVSLHSCGNLLHHGLRSLIVNPSVKAVVMIGCCYNLVTERLCPPTHKSPSLRTSNLRIDQTSSACDPHGFPMSERLANFQHLGGEGIRLNITARMMACQAPQNWTAEECESFFTRHFYRALLQRIFVDHGVVTQPVAIPVEMNCDSPKGGTEVGPAITIGSLRKSCYASVTSYVRSAMKKMVEHPSHGERISKCLEAITDEDILAYGKKYGSKKKDLSIIWSLMAFSASIVESIIIVDRWLYLREQSGVKECWVEAVFDYVQSPRNLVVVGIKK